jgi:hypothetical protein
MSANRVTNLGNGGARKSFTRTLARAHNAPYDGRMESLHHLAQINLARMIAPLDDPRMAGFVAELEPINALADRSPGFVWRLRSDAGDAAGLPLAEDPSILVNLSVWESFEALHAFVYRSAHAPVMRQRKRWFSAFEGPYYALFWIARGAIPTVAEGMARIRVLAERGATADAFWFGAPFPPPGGAPLEPRAG